VFCGVFFGAIFGSYVGISDVIEEIVGRVIGNKIDCVVECHEGGIVVSGDGFRGLNVIGVSQEWASFAVERAILDFFSFWGAGVCGSNASF